ncbi:hypothetical protein L7F22_041991 [Adiantum nelumboides]|nr:hypothetical protein [Adiantum nelumboides]
MMNQPESSELHRASDNDVDLLGNPTTLLVFNYLNDHGAQVFTNERNEFAILVNDQGETQSHPNVVYISDQGDHYMDARGFKFLKTNRPNDLNKWGNLVQGSRAASEPPRALEKGTSKVGFDVASRPMPAPSAPPLVHPYRNNAPAPSAATSPYLPGHLSPRPIAITYGKAILTSMPVTRVYNDQNFSVLYEDAQKDLYVMMLLPNGFYPPTVTMNVYESQGGRSFEYVDDWANVYAKATNDDVKYLTWHGIPIEKRHMGNLPYIGSAAPFNPMRKPTMSGHARHVLHAEEVDEVHTMVQGFGLTLEGKALRWFQSLGNSMLYDFEVLIAAFIKENTKTGIKHNILTQILDFKQREKETVKDAIARLKSLISRCPLREMPAEDCLISCFLEGLTDRSLHMQLIGQKHIRLDNCFDDALLYEDNCNLGRASLATENAVESNHASGPMNQEAIADLVMKKIRHERMNLMNRERAYPRAYVCGACSGNHPTGTCMKEGNTLSSGLIWCEICKRYGSHGTNSCYFKARVQQQQQSKQRGYQNRGNPSVGGNLKRSVPVLRTQPPLPGAAAVRYVDVASNEATNTQDLVPVGTYYEEEYNYNDYYSDPIYDDHQQQLMMVGQRPPNNYGRVQPGIGRGRNPPPQGSGPCFKCGSMDHWARDCPKETQPHMDWPKVERYCPGCHVDHLSKDCPSKPVAAMAGPSTSSLNFVEIIPSPSTSGIDEAASLRVVTRSQAKNGIPIANDDQARPSPKKKRRKKKNQKSVSGPSHEKLFEGSKEAEKIGEQKSSDGDSSQDKGGSVIIDRVDESL